MFLQDDLQELMKFDAQGGRVVTLYLNTDGSDQSQETIRLQARALLRELDAPYADDCVAIESYLAHSFDWSKPGLALFSCAEQDFFRAYPTAVPFTNRARAYQKPYVKPLVHLLDYYAHYGVILVDRIGARLFKFNLGELEETNGTIGEDIRKVKRGGGSANAGMRGGNDNRHEDELVLRNLRAAAEEVQSFFAQKNVRRFFIGGTTETVAQFRELLPKQMQSCIGGTFNIDMNAPEHEVRTHSLALLQLMNKAREEDVVRNMIVRAAKNENAVVGLQSTVEAISLGRVQNLIVSDGFRKKGFVSETTGFLTDHDAGNDNVVAVDDLIETAIARTMEQGGQVEVINGNEQLIEAGKIGAILRY